MTYKFHELLAAKTTGANIQKMFTKTRKGEEVLARMLCMVYVEQSHRMCQDDNAKRFGLKGHCSVSHSKRVLDDRSEYDAPFKQMVDKYLKTCFEHQEEESNTRNNFSTAKDYGLYGIIHEQNAVFVRLMDRANAFLSDECTDAEVLEAIEKAEESIEKLRFNFTK